MQLSAYIIDTADQSGRAIEHLDPGFQSQSRYGCLFVFFLSVLGSGHASGSSPVQGVLPDV
jgi:hypothetical protein